MSKKPFARSDIFNRALAFAQKHHKGQRRDGGVTPYIEHPKQVAKYLQEIAGVTDDAILSAGLLHDLIEDSGVSYDDLEEQFGARIAGLVAELTVDKRLPKKLYREDLIRRLFRMSRDAKLIKLADVYANVQDMKNSGWSEERKREYLVYLRRIVDTIRQTEPPLSPELEKALRKFLPVTV